MQAPQLHNFQLAEPDAHATTSSRIEESGWLRCLAVYCAQLGATQETVCSQELHNKQIEQNTEKRRTVTVEKTKKKKKKKKKEKGRRRRRTDVIVKESSATEFGANPSAPNPPGARAQNNSASRLPQPLQPQPKDVLNHTSSRRVLNKRTAREDILRAAARDPVEGDWSCAFCFSFSWEMGRRRADEWAELRACACEYQ